VCIKAWAFAGALQKVHACKKEVDPVRKSPSLNLPQGAEPVLDEPIVPCCDELCCYIKFLSVMECSTTYLIHLLR
jgi:hypothetical protein